MLKNSALIVSVSVSQWTGRKLDRRATSSVETAFHTTGKAGNFNKRLLPESSELDDIARCASNIRQYFYEQTLPWCSEGARIISARNYIEFTAKIRDLKARFQDSVNAFLSQYNALKEKAKLTLGDLYLESEYPTRNEIERCFDCVVSFMPVPDIGDFRVQLLDDEKETFVKTIKDAESAAMRDCWERLYGVVKKASSTLSKPDAIFRDSLIENISDICKLLPKLNYSDNPDLESMRGEVEKVVAGISTETIRENTTERNNAAKTLDDITSKMSAFMGGN